MSSGGRKSEEKAAGEGDEDAKILIQTHLALTYVFMFNLYSGFHL